MAARVDRNQRLPPEVNRALYIKCVAAAIAPPRARLFYWLAMSSPRERSSVSAAFAPRSHARSALYRVALPETCRTKSRQRRCTTCLESTVRFDRSECAFSAAARRWLAGALARSSD